jgi:hypothetical protein
MINEILLGKQKIKQKNILKTRDHVTHEGKKLNKESRHCRFSFLWHN